MGEARASATVLPTGFPAVHHHGELSDTPNAASHVCVSVLTPRVPSLRRAQLAVLVLFGCVQLWMWLNPTPLSCDLELIRPQKFKVDVTDFFAPKVSAALQLVLNVRNNNMLRSMLLEQCTLVAYEAATSLKLGSAQQGSLVIAPFTTTRATISLQQLGGSLPQPEQRRLATEFLSQKALLLTIVATASSRLPFKGSKASTVATNSSKRVDLSTLTKEPFFQRQQASVEEEAPTSEPKVHDVPNV
jgi:hypothetical protein